MTIDVLRGGSVVLGPGELTAGARHAVNAADPRLGPATTAVPSALALRRWVFVASPVLAAALILLGVLFDPAPGLSGEPLWRLYAAHPEPLQIKALAFHWAFAFWFLSPLLTPALVAGRGRWIANLAGIVGFVGLATMPGLLISDWFDSAIGQNFGTEGNAAVAATFEAMWGPAVFVGPGLPCLVLALPLATLALWRAGRAPWWGIAAAVAGIVALAVSNLTAPGAAVAILAHLGVAAAFWRATRDGVDGATTP